MKSTNHTLGSHVYLIGYNDKVKIGKSGNPSKRLKELQTANHEKLSLFGSLGCLTAEEAFSLELELHTLYSGNKLEGEWFTLNTAERAYILENYGAKMATMPSDEVITAMKDLSNNGYKLLTYYYSKGDTWDWDSKHMCQELDVSSRTLVETTKELVDKEYLLIFKGTKSNPMTNVFIGRDAVAARKAPAKAEGTFSTLKAKDGK